jgi:hypothetical protein
MGDRTPLKRRPVVRVPTPVQKKLKGVPKASSHVASAMVPQVFSFLR